MATLVSTNLPPLVSARLKRLAEEKFGRVSGRELAQAIAYVAPILDSLNVIRGWNGWHEGVCVELTEAELASLPEGCKPAQHSSGQLHLFSAALVVREEPA